MHAFTFTCEHIIHVFVYESFQGLFWKLLGPPHWNPAFKCAWGIDMRTVKLIEGVFRVWYGRNLNV